LQEHGAVRVSVNDIVALPSRSREGHKGDFGEVLFVAGAAGYLGAPYFAAYSFLKAGGGYSRLAAPASIAPYIAAKGSEIVLIPLAETKSGSFASRNRHTLLGLAERLDMGVVGPGLSLDREAQDLARDLAANVEKPVIIDGDGLTAVSANLDILKGRKGPLILTPHPGEMSRLTGKTVGEINEDKIGLLQKTACRLRAVVVLKGAHTLIGYPDGQVFVNLSGNPGMAKAGTGDVLTGTIAAMNGLGLPIPEAARMGVFVHGFAGDLAAEARGEDGISAADIMAFLPLALKGVREGLPGDRREIYEVLRV
jgi:NAD(P)H-hydrate epimerase